MKKRSILHPKKKLTGYYAKDFWKGKKRVGIPGASKYRIQGYKRYMLARRNVDNTKSHYYNPETLSQKTFKAILDKCNINYTQYYIPEQGQKFYEFDFAIKDKRIAIEINGQRHYNKKSKTLKKKYRIRHQYLTQLGWKVIQLFHRFVYDQQFAIKEVINRLDQPDIVDRFLMTFCKRDYYKKYPSVKE